MSKTVSSTNLIVQKFGGATLADPSLIKSVARRVLEQSKKGPLIVVVSAMGTTTNSLIELARQVSKIPPRRELDMLLSVGERTSMSLLSMALHDLGGSAISFTGSQAGILTDEDHFNAKIADVKGFRVQEALDAGKIVILAGFQGVSPKTKEITTLGRGGSDVTAVAMAAAFGAKRCEILKEVSAIFTADPRMISSARPLRKLDYDELLEMTFWGAKVLHHRSVDLARHRGVDLYIGPASDDLAAGTLVGKGMSMFEQHTPLSLNSHETVLQIDLGSDGLEGFQRLLSEKEIASPQILGWNDKNHALVTAPEETLLSVKACGAKVLSPVLCSVTLTCSGHITPELTTAVLSQLKTKGIPAIELRISPLSVTLFLEQSKRKAALEALHPLIPA